MKRTAEFLTRANYGLVFGNFEMDMHDGEIRYKPSFRAAEKPLVPMLFAAAYMCRQ